MGFTQLRILRPGIARAVVEDGLVVVYHCMDNSRYRNGNPTRPLEFELDDGPVIEALLSSYPEGVTVGNISHPSEEEEDVIAIVVALFKEGFLMILDEATLPSLRRDDDSDDEDPF